MWHGSEQRTRDVLGQHGPQDGLRRGKTKPQCENVERPRRSRMDYSGFVARNAWKAQRLSNMGWHLFFTSCIRQGTVEAPRHWREMAIEILWNVELEEGSDGTSQ